MPVPAGLEQKQAREPEDRQRQHVDVARRAAQERHRQRAEDQNQAGAKLAHRDRSSPRAASGHGRSPFRGQDQDDAGDESEQAVEAEQVLDREMAVLS